MNILVTGANGQLGNEIQKLSIKTQNKFFFTDIQELDITDIDLIRAFVNDYSIDIIVNCAAYTNVDKAEDDIVTADLINNKAVNNLATIAKEKGLFLIHISTDYVFNGDHNIPYAEDVPTNPLGIYGKTKLDGELSVICSGCKYIIIRTSWLYSEYGNNFVKTMMKLISEKEILNVVFDQVGTPTYAADLADVIVHIIKNSLYINNQGIYHFSNEGVCSWYDFAKEIASLAGNTCEINPCHSDEFPSKVKRPYFSVLDKTKLKKDFNYKIPYWKESLVKCVNRLRTE